MLPPRLLVVHDSSRGSQDNVSKLTRRQQLDDPLLEITHLDVVSWGDDASLVETSVELDDNLAGSVVVDLLELANVAYNNTRIRYLCVKACSDELNDDPQAVKLKHVALLEKTCKIPSKG